MLVIILLFYHCKTFYKILTLSNNFLVGVASLVWRYGYLSKTAKFHFPTMEYSPWSFKILIDRNQLKKFMQLGIDVKCMHTHFGGRGLSSFGDMTTFQKRPNFPFRAWTI